MRTKLFSSIGTVLFVLGFLGALYEGFVRKWWFRKYIASLTSTSVQDGPCVDEPGPSPVADVVFSGSRDGYER